MEIHFIYAGDYYSYINKNNYDKFGDRLKSFILKGMEKYNIKLAFLTTILMVRWKLITKETMENHCNGKEDVKKSVNDDLEKLFEDIQLGKKLSGWVNTYVLPKLTKNELGLVERKDEDFMNTFYEGVDADVDKVEMMMSESDSKFVLGRGRRRTFTIENLLPEKHTEESCEYEPPHKKPRTFIETKNV